MKSNLSEPFVQQLIHLYQTSNIPAILTDADFQIIWCNQPAIHTFAPFALPDGVLFLLQGHPLDQVRQTIAQQGSFSIRFAPPFGAGGVKICALVQCPGFLALPEQEIPPEDGLCPEGVQRALSSFDSAYRTELSRIFSAINLVMQDCREQSFDQERIEKLLSIANNSCYRLLRSCEWILYHTHLSSGMLKLREQRLDIFALLRIFTETAALLLEPLHIPVEGTFPKESFFISCDAEKLSLVLFNLISNSARFTRPGNHIVISVSHQVEEEQLVIKVTDSGIGIPQKVLPHVFEPYYSCDCEGFHFGGNGLGLTIAKEIIALMGGTITISSRKGSGTSVVFTIPAREPDRPLPPLLASSPSDYVDDRFSLPHVALSDCIDSPI